MESVSGRTAQVGALAYVLGGGFALFKSIDDWLGLRRHPLQQWILDEQREGKPVPTGSAQQAAPVEAQLRRAASAQRQAARPVALSPSPAQVAGASVPLPNAWLTAMRYGNFEGWRSSKVAMAGIFVAHSVALGRHGRYDPRTHAPLEVPVAVAAGTAAASYAYLDYLPAAPRASKALMIGLALGGLDGLRLMMAAQRHSGGGGGGVD